jgi:hypothetical protein
MVLKHEWNEFSTKVKAQNKDEHKRNPLHHDHAGWGSFGPLHKLRRNVQRFCATGGRKGKQAAPAKTILPVTNPFFVVVFVASTGLNFFCAQISGVYDSLSCQRDRAQVWFHLSCRSRVSSNPRVFLSHRIKEPTFYLFPKLATYEKESCCAMY